MTILELLRPTTLKAACLITLAAPAAWYETHHGSAKSPQAGGEWKLIFDRASPGRYEDISFPDSLHGWVVHARGDILHTEDGGATWTVQATARGNLRSVDFVDTKRGFAGTLSGKLWATTDGGDTWTDITETMPKTPGGFCGMFHIGQKVHIVGRYRDNITDYFYSPDAGKTWKVTDLSDLAQGLVDVNFLNESVGFIGGMAKAPGTNNGPATILKTTDGGKTWRTVFTHDGGRGFAWKIFPMSAKLIYASLQSQDGIYRIAKSIDGGEHFDVLTVATGRNQGPAIQGIGFIDEKTGWVGGFFVGMWTTSDGGQTWTELKVPDGVINRFERVGHTLITAGSRGVLRYEAH